MKHLSYLFLFFTLSGMAQPRELSLPEALQMAEAQSLAAFRAENVFLADYWEFRSYKAQLRPGLRLDLQPVRYHRQMTRRYNYDENREEYREQQSLNSYGNLAVTQRIPFTGGELYIDSDLGRLVNYNTSEAAEYTATPFRVGLVQPIWGFNELKWQRRLSPLKYEKARKDYLQELQHIRQQTVAYFFQLMQARMQYTIADENRAISDTLYQMAGQRFAIASLSRNDLLDLRLNRIQAETQLIEAERSLQQARFELNSFLGLPEDTELLPVLPEQLPNIRVQPRQALDRARQYNPEMLGMEQALLEARRALDASQKARYADASLVASYGLNQVGEQITAAYQQPLSQQVVSLSLQIPLVDWGERRGNYLMAQKNQEVVQAEVQQQTLDFNKRVILKAMEFNSQRRLVAKKAEARTIAKESYAITQQQFLAGNADVLRLNSSQQAFKQARLDYVRGVYLFWKNYYELQALTLYDFQRQQALTADFESLINQ